MRIIHIIEEMWAWACIIGYAMLVTAQKIFRIKRNVINEKIENYIKGMLMHH